MGKLTAAGRAEVKQENWLELIEQRPAYITVNSNKVDETANWFDYHGYTLKFITPVMLAGTHGLNMLTFVYTHRRDS